MAGETVILLWRLFDEGFQAERDLRQSARVYSMAAEEQYCKYPA
ncbi:hypothetical protein [Kosakonia sp. MUSA4]|nr:hypothetical protein [Kosakonia sp. MUSA4]